MGWFHRLMVMSLLYLGPQSEQNFPAAGSSG